MDTGEIPAEWPVWKEDYRHAGGFGGGAGAFESAYLPLANAHEVQQDLKTIEGALDWRYSGQISAERREAVSGPNRQYLREEYDRQLRQLDLSSQLAANSERIKELEAALEREVTKRRREEKREAREAEEKRAPPEKEQAEQEAAAGPSTAGPTQDLEKLAAGEGVFADNKTAKEAEQKAAAENKQKDSVSSNRHRHIFSRKLMKQLL